MARLESAAFSVSVDNEAEVRAWLNEVGALRDAAKAALDALIDQCRAAPLIQMSIHRCTHEENDEQGQADAEA